MRGPMAMCASFFADPRRAAVANGAIYNGTFLNPATFGIINPFTDVFRIPQRRIRSNPRADYQISPNNTLTLRYGFVHAEIPSAGVGGFNLISRAAHSTAAAHTIQATETAVFAGKMVNVGRFWL